MFGILQNFFWFVGILLAKEVLTMSNRQFRIALMRESAGLSQQDVADALGVKKGRYGDWERETREINLRDAIKLADLFNCSLDDLAGHKAPDQPSITADEQTIVDTYRAAGRLGKRVILATAREVAEDMELDAREKRAV